MRKFADWCHSHPWISSLCAGVLFFSAMHLFLNWRAEQRWHRYAAEAEARGVKMTLAEFASPEIPDAENFAALPMMRAIFTGGVQRPMELPRGNGKSPSFGNPVNGERMDWPAWQALFHEAGWITAKTDNPPDDVLRALDHLAPQIQQWKEWRTRPRCRFPLDLEAGMAMPLPHLGTFTDAAKLFALRMRARLALGDSPGAYVEFQDGLQAWRALQDEPTLVSGLVQIAALATLTNAVGAGLQEHAWAEPELEKLTADFGAIPVWKDHRRAFASERGFGNGMYKMLLASSPSKRADTMNSMFSPSGANLAGSALALIPRRVYRDNQLQHNRYLDEVLARVSADGLHYNPASALPSAPETLKSGFDKYYHFLFCMSAPVFSSVEGRFAMMHTILDEARIACALARFHQAQGEYPVSLEELSPRWIPAVPLDVYSGHPLIYRRDERGTFHLYGVGKNRVDDGGLPNPKTRESDQLDTIWLYAPSP